MDRDGKTAGVLSKPGLLRLCKAAGIAGAVVLVGLALSVWYQPVLRHPRVLLALYRAPAPTRLPMPVPGILPRQLADTFGAPRPNHRRHRGIDIFAPCGAPVLSTTAGIATKVGTNRLGGNVAYILGPGLRLHYFAHLDHFGSFRTGDPIREGDVLGFVGSSGNARGTPCHLHFEVRVPGQGSVNPYPLLVSGAKEVPASSKAASS